MLPGSTALPASAATDDYDAARATLGWQLARRALTLALADPEGLGGVVLHGRHGPARDALLSTLTRHDAPRPSRDEPDDDTSAHRATADARADRTVRRIPPDADDDALVGGLDTTATLARGIPVYRRGLLDASAGQVLLLGGAERLSMSVATRLCEWLDGYMSSARPSGTRTMTTASGTPSRAPLVALDESLDVSGLVESALGERIGLHVAVPDLALAELRRMDDATNDPVHAGEAADARHPVPLASPADVHLSSDRLDGIVRLADRLGIVSLRAPTFACRAARTIAWLAGRDAVTDDDAALAVQLVLAPRARLLPDAPAEPEIDPIEEPADGQDTPPLESDEPPDDEPVDERLDEQAGDERPDSAPDDGTGELDAVPPDPEASADDSPDDTLDDRELPERLVEAVAAALPRNLLDELAAGRVARNANAGRDSGASAAAEENGRPIGTRRPRGGHRRRPNLLATLKAAIPYQRLRAIEADGVDVVATGDRPRLRVRRDDFRVTRYRRPTRTTTLFVVDASGSAAMHRLAEAKGAVESLLAECYVRRDRVALVTFRGDGASLDLPPTRSLVRAKRALVGLPGGGGTPLAAGLDLAAGQLERIAASGESPVGVIMTDGRGNVSRDGTGGRAQAREDAEHASARLARIGARLLFVDTGPRPRPEPRHLAALMGARYLPLPQLAGALSGDAVSGKAPSGVAGTRR